MNSVSDAVTIAGLLITVLIMIAWLTVLPTTGLLYWMGYLA